ncbi:MAG TPA: sensor domain-containing diguanylate cyclase [Rectinemataceae bacterium]|nr:sensor domain-containing diguanylate cyclase [Rectinemataceae bacterium]
MSGHRGIIEQRTALEALKANEALYRSIVEMSPNAIVIIQPDGSISAANSQTLGLFGLESLSDFLGRDAFDFILPEERDRAESDLGRVAMSEKLYNLEYRLLRQDRTAFWAEVSGNLIPETDGKPGGILVTARDISKRKSMEENLRNLAVTDELTGLYNRRGFSLAAEQELKHAHRTKTDLVLLFFDMDKLKAINDTFGHAEGDEALKAAAAALRSTFRASDIIARWGGDEFAVLALDVPKGSISVLQHRLDETLERLNSAEGMRYRILFSVGMSRYDFEHPLMLQEMVRIADGAMYQKKQGKGM